MSELNQSILHQLRKFCEFEKQEWPDKKHIAQWALEEIEQLGQQLTTATERSEKAEAKLKELSEQKPVMYVRPNVVRDSMRGVRFGATRSSPLLDEEDELTFPIYAAPISSPSEAGLQKRIDLLNTENSLLRQSLDTFKNRRNEALIKEK